MKREDRFTGCPLTGDGGVFPPVSGVTWRCSYNVGNSQDLPLLSTRSGVGLKFWFDRSSSCLGDAGCW